MIVIQSKATNAKFINQYIERDGYTELKITDQIHTCYSIKIDDDDVDNCIKHFWCCNYVGRKGFEAPSVYCYVNREKLFLSRMILKEKKKCKIVFINRNNLDFRKENLYVSVSGKSQIKTSRLNSSIPAGIFEKRQSSGMLTGYLVSFFEESHKKGMKYFGIKKYGSTELALLNAIAFKTKTLKQEGVLQSE